MPEFSLPHEVWNQIYEEIDSRIPRREFMIGRVTKRDEVKKQIWVAELGTQPIPLAALDYVVKYYDDQPTGNTTTVGSPVNKVTKMKETKENDVKVRVPKVGQTVVIFMIGGQRRLAFCLGILQGVME